jgi:hypothetical protein
MVKNSCLGVTEFVYKSLFYGKCSISHDLLYRLLTAIFNPKRSIIQRFKYHNLEMEFGKIFDIFVACSCEYKYSAKGRLVEAMKTKTNTFR